MNYPNETIKVLCERASLRNFSDKQIPQDVLNYILKAGAQAASGGNLQPLSIIKIEKQEVKDRLTELCGGQKFISKAPVNLLFCIDWHRSQRWAEVENAPFTANQSFKHFWISFQDTIIAAQNICTAADALGLGSVYVGTVLECFYELKEMFDLPDGVFPVVLLSLGYPKTQPEMRKKFDIDVLVHDEKYNKMDDEQIFEAFNKKYGERKIDITDERMQTIEENCTEVGGQEFANKVIESIKERGYINMAQMYFGLHYRANLMPKKNLEYQKTMEDYGFSWFKEFKGKKE